MSMESKDLAGEYAKFEASKAEKVNKIFKKYNLKLLENGSIEGPEKPKYYSETPKFNYDDTGEIISENDRKFLKENLGKDFSAADHQREVLGVINSISKRLTGKHYSNYANIIIMDKNDFREIKSTFKPMVEGRGVSGDFHGINLGGLIICEDMDGSKCFPLLLHEFGHSLYPDEEDTYKDELRAMYFQVIGTKLLEKEFKRAGFDHQYPDNYYENVPLPSEEHRKAFADARMLYSHQLYYDEVVKGDDKRENAEDKLLKIVKQDTKSFKK